MKYPPAHEQLLALAKRSLGRGEDFAAFWAAAVRPGQKAVTWADEAEERPSGCVVWPRDTTDRNVSIAATLGAREGWRRAYEQMPPDRGEKALERLRPALNALAIQMDAESSGKVTAAA